VKTSPSQALQRVIVRMLHDPSLVERIYTGEVPDAITAPQAAMLRRSPKAAWGSDPYRASRTPQALLEEYPVSAAGLGPRPLHGFFRATAFHQSTQTRGILAADVGPWLTPHAGQPRGC